MRFTHGLASRLVVVFPLAVWPLPSPADQLPDGWFLSGTHPEDYSVGTTRGLSQEGKVSLYLASKSLQPAGFGTLMQKSTAHSYRGQRLRMTGSVKAEAVDGWAGLWMRVDGSRQRGLSFDNMQDRPIKGTRDWQRYVIVLEVPQESTHIAFGILLQGKGKVYLGNLDFEVVPPTVETTDVTRKMAPSAPLNLTSRRETPHNKRIHLTTGQDGAAWTSGDEMLTVRLVILAAGTGPFERLQAWAAVERVSIGAIGMGGALHINAQGTQRCLWGDDLCLFAGVLDGHRGCDALASRNSFFG